MLSKNIGNQHSQEWHKNSCMGHPMHSIQAMQFTGEQSQNNLNDTMTTSLEEPNEYVTGYPLELWKKDHSYVHWNDHKQLNNCDPF